MTTITPGDKDHDRTVGWREMLVKAVQPAFYDSSWAPWLRIIITAALVFVAVMVWRLYGG